MPTAEEWVTIIKGRGGKIASTVTVERLAAQWDMIDASWFYHNSGDEKKKPVRDLTAREMRKDKWEVKTESNSLGWFISAKRRT